MNILGLISQLIGIKTLRLTVRGSNESIWTLKSSLGLMGRGRVERQRERELTKINTNH